MDRAKVELMLRKTAMTQSNGFQGKMWWGPSDRGSGDDALISGFGKFCINKKRERRGRNPVTGGDIMLDARKVADTIGYHSLSLWNLIPVASILKSWNTIQ